MAEKKEIEASAVVPAVIGVIVVLIALFFLDQMFFAMHH